MLSEISNLVVKISLYFGTKFYNVVITTDNWTSEQLHVTANDKSKPLINIS